MRTVRKIAASVVLTSLMAACGVPSGAINSLAPLPVDSATSANCAGDFHELTPEHTRSPVQIDLNAGYYQGTIANLPGYSYVVRGQFPNSILMTWVIYGENGQIYSAIHDRQVRPDPANVNPFVPGSRVLARNRRYTLFLHAAGTPVPKTIPPSNVMLLPPVPSSGSNRMYVTDRSYWSQPGVPRIGGPPSRQPPTILAVDARDPGKPVACPGTGSGLFSPPPSLLFPQPVPGRILFFRIPSALIPLADGTQRATPASCTGYGAAALDPKLVNLVKIHRVPRFPDNQGYTKTSVWRNDFAVRYVGLEANGASFLGPNSDVAMNGIKLQPDASAYFMLISRTAPIALRDRQRLSAYANVQSWNQMPAAKPGAKLFPNPVVIYRNKLPRKTFAYSTNAMPCFTAEPWNRAPASDASSPANMGRYYIDGVVCKVEDVLSGACAKRAG